MWWTQLSLTWIKGWDGCSLHTFKSNCAKIRNIQKADQEADDSAPPQEKKTPNSFKFCLLLVVLLSQVAALLFPDIERLETHISQSRQEDNNN